MKSPLSWPTSRRSLGCSLSWMIENATSHRRLHDESNAYSDFASCRFNVKKDLSEWKDLSEKMPEKKKELVAKLDGYLKRVKATNAAMTKEEVHAMQNIPPEGFGGYSKPLKTGKATEYPVNSFPKSEDPTLP